MRGLAGVARGAAVGAVLVGLTACDAPTLPLNESPSAGPAERPYDFRLPVTATAEDSTGHRTFHWPLGTEVRILVLGEIEGRPLLRPALDRGLGRWNRAAVFGEFRLSATSEPTRADAVLMWDDAEPIYSSPAGCTGPTSGAAGTRGCLTPGQDSLQVWPLRNGDSSRLLFRVTINRAAQLDQETVDVLVAHELGHVVGILNHSSFSGDLMWSGRPQSSALSERDRLTLRSLYQTEPTLFPSR